MSWTEFLPSALQRATPSGRRRQMIAHAHDKVGQLPGLRHVDEQGTLPITTARGTHIAVPYYRVGPRVNDDNHTTVVFVHGFTLAAESFFLQVDYLQEHFPEVTSLLLDVRGHGACEDVAAHDCTIDGVGGDITQLIDAHAPAGKLVLVGHSLGGMAVLNVLRTAPPRIRRRVARVLLISTAIESLASQGVPQVLASPAADAVHGVMEQAPDAVQRIRSDVAELLAPALATTVFFRDDTPQRIIEFHAAMIQATPVETIAGFFNDVAEHEETAAVEALRDIPGIVLVGDKDRFTPPAQSELLAARWDVGQLEVICGAGHMVILEAPGAVNAALGDVVAPTVGAGANL